MLIIFDTANRQRDISKSEYGFLTELYLAYLVFFLRFLDFLRILLLHLGNTIYILTSTSDRQTTAHLLKLLA